MKAMTVRLEDELYKKIKIMLVEEDSTFQDYMMKLIQKDLEFRKVQNQDGNK